MKTSVLLLLFFSFGLSAFAQNQPALEKVETIDSLIHTLYSVISGEKGEVRDWELFHALFADGAQLIRTGKNQEGKIQHQYHTPSSFQKASEGFLMENGFHEIELRKEIDQYGTIAQVFSTYASYYSKNDKTPFMRGINSIQLMNDGKRWWVVNIFWMNESEEFPIPKEYLPKQ